MQQCNPPKNAILSGKIRTLRFIFFKKNFDIKDWKPFIGDWPETHALSCKEDSEEGSTNVHTLRDIYSQDIILTLMDPSTLKSNDPDDDSEGGPTAPLTPTSPIPKEKT